MNSEELVLELPPHWIAEALDPQLISTVTADENPRPLGFI